MCCFSFLFWQSESVASLESLCLLSLLLLRSAGRFPPVFHFSSLLGGAQNRLRASLNANCNKKAIKTQVDPSTRGFEVLRSHSDHQKQQKKRAKNISCGYVTSVCLNK